MSGDGPWHCLWFAIMLTLLIIAVAKTRITTSPTTTTGPNAGLYSISGFLNSGSAHSTVANLSFQLSSPDPLAPLSNVYCSYSQSVNPTIASTTNDIACNGTSVLFSFQYFAVGLGYYLNVAHVYNDTSSNSSTVDAGVVYMGNNVETVVNGTNSNGNFQRLVHPTDFVMGYNRVQDCC